MKNTTKEIAHSALFLFLSVLTFSLLFAQISALPKPDLFIGAGGVAFGCGSNSPAVQRPFSYVRLGPDTTPLIKQQYIEAHHFGGYSTMDHGLRAISHMHLVGAGVQDMGVLGILPIKSSSVKIPKDPQAILYKNTQYAEPGYYKTAIQGNISIQLTTSQRAGYHRYIFPHNNNSIDNGNDKNKSNIKSKTSSTMQVKQGTDTFQQQQQRYQILIMSSYLLQKKAKRFSKTRKCALQSQCIQGDIFMDGGFGGRFGGYHMFYHLQWTVNGQKQQKTDNVNMYMYDDTSIYSPGTNQTNQVSGNFSGVIMQLVDHSIGSIQLRVGLSYVSIANAKQNLQEQIGSKSFQQLKQQSQERWRQEFSRFQISAISQSHQVKIDTALYRSFLTPTLFSDINGQYMSFSLNGTVMTKPDQMQGVYTDMSLWDVHRTHFPWMLFQDEQRFNDIAKSLLLINREGQYMPKWPFAYGPTSCMIGAHANTVLADWVVKEAMYSEQFTVAQILQYMTRNANTITPHDSRSNPPQYIKKGYMSIEQRGNSASCSQTLQLSYNDFGIAQVAGVLNKTDVQKDFLNRSKFYKNVWNPATKYFEPRFDNKSFVKMNAFDRLNFFSNHYTEGDAWQYRFYAPHDPEGLISLFGGKEDFTRQLDIFFRRSFLWPTNWLPNPYYWAGNQHNLLSVWEFNFANRTDLSAKYSRMIIDTQYGLDGAGLPGNDDYGTMSAWLIFASLGFYPIPSTQRYALGSPIISSARITRKMGDGRRLVLNINVNKNSVRKHKVEQVMINGKKLNNGFVNHQDFGYQNSILSFVMQW